MPAAVESVYVLEPSGPAILVWRLIQSRRPIIWSCCTSWIRNSRLSKEIGSSGGGGVTSESTFHSQNPERPDPAGASHQIGLANALELAFIRQQVHDCAGRFSREQAGDGFPQANIALR